MGGNSGGSRTAAALIAEHHRRATALLAAGDAAAAERELRCACAEFSDHASLWGLLTTACWENGQREAALTAIDRALALDANAPFLVHKGWMLFQLGRLDDAEATLKLAVDTCPQPGSAYQNLTQVYKVAERWHDGAASAARACAVNPTDFDMRESWASCLLHARRPDEAIAVIDDGLRLFTTAPHVFQLQMQKAEACQQCGDSGGAIAALAAALALKPNDRATLERICYRLLVAGRHHEAQPYRQRLQAMQASELPATLRDGLDALWESEGAPAPDPAALEWAWELADKSVWRRDEWQIAASWGREASLLLRRWWDSAPEKVDQIDQLLDPPDLGELDAAIAGGGACLLVSAHVGPMGPGLHLLRTRYRFRTVGTADRDQLDSRTLLPVTTNYLAITRALVREVTSGSVIALMGDEPLARGSFAVEFLGREIHLPGLVPRLIQAFSLPSFWCCPLWRGDRVFLELERLPDPRNGESRAAWSRRWFSAYLEKIARVMRGRPENLGLYSGIWANVNRTVIEHGQRRTI